MKKLFLMLVVLCGVQKLRAQAPPTYYNYLSFDSGTATPGSCSAPGFFFNTSNNTFYACNNQTGHFVTAGGGGGTTNQTIEEVGVIFDGAGVSLTGSATICKPV